MKITRGRYWGMGAVLIACAAAITAGAAGDDGVPDEGAMRTQIDEIIKQFQSDKKPATLGMMQETMDLSISFGAPIWNTGDHKACATFYMKTAESLVKAFGAEGAATPAGRATIEDLKKALARVKGSEDADKNAWALRYAFDKTHLAMEVEATRGAGLLALGEEYLKRSNFDEAEDAYASAERVLKEMDGWSPERIPLACRAAPFMHANALFGQKKYADAAAAIERGTVALPAWRESKEDLRGLYMTPDDYEAQMDDLRAQVEKSPKDAELQFLLGYEYFYTGHKGLAKTQFEAVLKLDPKHAGAKFYLEGLPKKRPTTKNAEGVDI